MSMGIYLLLILLGLVIGSFAGAVTWRIPKGEDFVLGRSYCDSCKKELRWSDNIPLFSFLLYQGKSRCCSKKIGLRYPLIEVSMAIGFVFLFLSSLSPLYYALYAISLVIFVIDLEHQIIPDELTWVLLLFGLYSASNILFANLFAGFFVALLLLLLYLLTLGRGIGLGDVKLAIPLGMLLGFEKGLTFIILSFVIGGLIAMVLLILKKATMKSKIAFGPFMIISFWMIMLFIK
jgi:leader peptidase (prepilin peptidase)/N-methyltransferase